MKYIHYIVVKWEFLAYLIDGNSTVCSIICYGYLQRKSKDKTSTLLTICEGINTHKGPVMQEVFQRQGLVMWLNVSGV